jgi:hypothetical protein
MCVYINACIFVYVCLPLMKWYVPILVAAHGSSVESYLLCVLENKTGQDRLFHGFNYLEINLKWKYSASLVHLKHFRWIESQFPKRNSYYTFSQQTLRKVVSNNVSPFFSWMSGINYGTPIGCAPNPRFTNVIRSMKTVCKVKIRKSKMKFPLI